VSDCPPLSMFYVYILQSLKSKKLYVGFTADLRRRLNEHNSGLSSSTKYSIPWNLVYYEDYQSERDARVREKKLKQFKNSYSHLKNRIINCLRT